MSFNQLPPELMISIYDHCDTRLLKQLRLTNHASHDAVTARIFREVDVGLLEHSLIAYSEKLAPLVIKLNILGKHLSPMSFRAWREQISLPILERYGKKLVFKTDHSINHAALASQDVIEGRNGKLEPSHTDLKRYWMNYRDFPLEQRTLTTGAMVDAKSAISLPLASLPNLRKVAVGDPLLESKAREPAAMWLNLSSKTHIIHGYDDPPHEKDNNAAVHMLLKGLVSRQKHGLMTPKVRVTLHGPRFWADQCDFTESAQDTGPFERTEDLRLSVSMEDTGDVDAVHYASNSIVSWLNGAALLRRLKLQLSCSRGAPWDVLRHVRKDALPCLRDLELGVEIEEEVLVGFLRNHNSKIEHFTLAHCKLLEGTWQSVLLQIPQLLPKLQTVRLKGPLHPIEGLHCDSELDRLQRDPQWLHQYTEYAVGRAQAPSFDLVGLAQDLSLLRSRGAAATPWDTIGDWLGRPLPTASQFDSSDVSHAATPDDESHPWPMPPIDPNHIFGALDFDSEFEGDLPTSDEDWDSDSWTHDESD